MIRIEDARMYYSDDPVHGFDHVLRVLALAQERQAFMEAFFERLAAELRGEA